MREWMRFLLLSWTYVNDANHPGNPNGSINDKFLWYFWAHRRSERVARSLMLDNAELRERLRKATGEVATASVPFRG